MDQVNRPNAAALIQWQHMFNASSRLTNYIEHWSPVVTMIEFKLVWSRVLRFSDLLRRKKTSSLVDDAGMLTTNTKLFSRSLKTTGLSIALMAGSISVVAYQDMQSLADNDQRWLMHLPQGPGQSIASASTHGLDRRKTGSVVSASMADSMDFDQLTASLPKAPKPQVINRDLKGDRVVSSTIQRPPAHFSAGSVLQRNSLLTPLNAAKNQSLAFVKPKSAHEAFEVAAVFHAKEDRNKKRMDKLPVVVASLVQESESSILSYSEEPETKFSPFAAVLRDEGPVSIIPKLNNGDHLWADDPLPKASFSKKQQTCLANGIYFEARGEPARGQAAVAQVILNRVRNPAYPGSICGVVYQNKHWRNRCQFSFACDRIRDRISNPKLWTLAKQIAAETTAGRIWLTQVGSSTHYHATYVNPKWARSMKKVGKIGLHIFYRTKGGGWS